MITKATLLSFLHFSPIYVFPVVVGIEIVFMSVEFLLRRKEKLHPQWWLASNVLANLSLISLAFLPSMLLSLLLSSAFVLSSLAIDLFIHVKEFLRHNAIHRMKNVQETAASFQKHPFNQIANQTLSDSVPDFSELKEEVK